LLDAILDKIIIKFDTLQILRGYRNKLKDFPEYNNFKTRRIEKFILPFENNLYCKLDINFHNFQFNLQINKQIINNTLEGIIKSNQENLNLCPINSDDTTNVIKDPFMEYNNNQSRASIIKNLSTFF
jgi:hypothetical protein